MRTDGQVEAISQLYVHSIAYTWHKERWKVNPCVVYRKLTEDQKMSRPDEYVSGTSHFTHNRNKILFARFISENT